MKPKQGTRGLFLYRLRQSVSKEAREGHVSEMLRVLLSDTKILQGSDVQDLLP